jgi:hypothetical protein
MKKPLIVDGKKFKPRLILLNPQPLIIDGKEFKLYEMCLSQVPQETYCRACDGKIAAGTRAYFRPGEVRCFDHFNDRHVPVGMRAYVARWRSRCRECREIVRPGQPMFWRSKTVCFTCASGKVITPGRPWKTSGQRSIFAFGLEPDFDVEEYDGRDSYGSLP